jgi:hypothetical protein
MSFKIGDIDSIQIVDNEFRISVLERFIDAVIVQNPSLNVDVDFSRISNEVLLELQQKYPNSDLHLKSKEG